MNTKTLFVLLGLTFALTSCKTKEKASELNYMQNIEQVAVETSLKNAVSTIQPGDQLVIFVSAKDLDVVKPFNLNYSSGEIVQNAQSGGNMASSGQTVISGPTYI